jgi:hypothetical protein
VAEVAGEAAEAVAAFTEASTRNTATNLTSIVLYSYVNAIKFF